MIRPAALPYPKLPEYEQPSVSTIRRTESLLRHALDVHPHATGVSAPMLGLEVRAIMLQPKWGAQFPALGGVVWNPRITAADEGLQTVREATLATDRLVVDVARPPAVRAAWTKLTVSEHAGGGFTVQAVDKEYLLTAYAARIVQQLAETLDGVTLLDHATRQQRRAYMREQEKIAKAAARELASLLIDVEG